jgi:hypothetical protein
MMESANYKVPYYVFIYPPVTFSFLHPNIVPSKRYKRENTQLRFYKVISTPALVYNSETWTLTARETEYRKRKCVSEQLSRDALDTADSEMKTLGMN